MSADERADVLLRRALEVAYDIRFDLPAAHRVLAHLDRVDLEGVASVLAALVPLDVPLVPWWQYKPATRNAREGMFRCGTNASYRRHRRFGEDCPPCTKAHAEYERDRYRTRRAVA